MVEDKGTGLYTLVVSQYEKSSTIHYTLRVYATCEFKLAMIAEPYNPKYEKHVSSSSRRAIPGDVRIERKDVYIAMILYKKCM